MELDPRTANNVADAQRLLKTEHFDLCLTDMQLPDGDGLELVKWMQQYAPSVPVAVITAHGNMETAVRALKLGAFDFVSKPLDLAGLRKLVASAIKLSGTLDTDTSVFGPRLLGASAAMQHLRDMIGRVARSQAPVHIFGESGTGKELVAKLIHESGPRRDGPFVPVNCGAIPTELMESELFGHKRGSFTGAVSDKRGLIQSAEGGTLFLDEIADLPLHMQVKLLRVIQEKAVRPLGEQLEVGVDVRILSATHKNLSALVAEGKFREDLFYRVNVIELRVPSLRERPEDVPELAEAILRRLGRRMKIYPADAGQGRAGRAPGLRLSRKRARTRKHPRARDYSEHRRRSKRKRHPTAANPWRCARRRQCTERTEHWGIIWKTSSATPFAKPGADPIQQDGGGESLGDVVPGAAVPHQEAGHRMRTFVTQSTKRYCVIM